MVALTPNFSNCKTVIKMEKRSFHPVISHKS